jgi:hypothetical protein
MASNAFYTLQALRAVLLMEDKEAIKETIRDIVASLERPVVEHGGRGPRPAGDDIVPVITRRDEAGNLQLSLCRTDRGYVYVPVADGWARRIPESRGTGAGLPCPCRAAQGFEHGWCGVAGGGVPACDH